MGWKKINVDVTRRRGGSMPPRMGSAQRAPAWKATLREALCVFFVVGRVVLRTEQKQAASAPDHQHDECETEEQIELRLLQFERYRDEAQGDRRQDRQRMPIPGLGVEAIEQEDGDAHRQEINQDSQHAEHAEPPERYCRPKDEKWERYSIQPPPSVISPS